MKTLLLPLLALSFAVSAGETLLVAPRIHTLNPAQPTATAMVWNDAGVLLAVGEAQALRRAYPEARQTSARNATVVPGLIDAHGHIMGLGFALLRADLTGTRSKAEAIARLKAFEKNLPKGEWLLGRGWDQNDWPEAAFPTAADLDAAFPERPVWLERVDSHAGWANSAAIRRAKRDLGGDWQPDGGQIERIDGEPSGVFVDTATQLIDAVVPPPGEALREQALRRALSAASRAGLTGVHDMGVSRADLALYRRFADAGRLPLRITAYADGDSDALSDLCANGRYQHAGQRLRMPGVKLYADGALGSRGAALIEDYSDAPGSRGLLVTDAKALERAATRARDCGLQVAAHAIGDRANRLVLDLYDYLLKPAGDAARPDRRWRIEHAQVVPVADIPRFATLGVIASMQPTHATSDMPWAETRVGPERIKGAYAWQRVLQSGGRLALGSDFPVESVDPQLGLYAAVTRQDLSGQPDGGWYPDQRLTAFEALRGFTVDAAYAGFADSEVGMLKPGLRADFLVLNEDPLTVPPLRLKTLGLRSTWIDGKPVSALD
ncbi:amidohydrolase [Nevskia sp.]|uniref:amidohydrolase n=1 Tax=Nevskia sp. TaxID=1929292 RepID=UPI0025FCA070|nr:amidohydrolase [Nevskia sp.]